MALMWIGTAPMWYDMELMWIGTAPMWCDMELMWIDNSLMSIDISSIWTELKHPAKLLPVGATFTTHMFFGPSRLGSAKGRA